MLTRIIRWSVLTKMTNLHLQWAMGRAGQHWPTLVRSGQEIMPRANGTVCAQLHCLHLHCLQLAMSAVATVWGGLIMTPKFANCP